MLQSLILENARVRLEPINANHKSQLQRIIKTDGLNELFFTFVPHVDEVDSFISDANHLLAQNQGIAFAVIDKCNEALVGSTRLFRADIAHKKAEIGFTFFAKSAQGTGLNKQCKLLMLAYAFEQLKLNRVEFLTDFLNQHSKRAILSLGAKEEGILRNHMVMRDGRVRDSVIYSILRNEWYGVKQLLHSKLD